MTRLGAIRAALVLGLLPLASVQAEPSLDLAELEASVERAREVIADCRAELPPCDDEASRQELALAFLVVALQSWVSDGLHDAVSVANARRLHPDLAARWEAQFPVGSEPAEAWVEGLLPDAEPAMRENAGVAYVARAGQGEREILTFRVGFEGRPVPCSVYDIEAAGGLGRRLHDCPQDVGGRASLDLRSPHGLLVRFGGAGSRWWTEDSHFLHLQLDTLDSLPISGYRVEGRAALGIARRVGPGELRASAGGLVRAVGLSMSAVETLFEDYNYAPPYLAATSAGGWFAVEWEANLGEVRLQPHLQVEIANEVGWTWRLANPELNQYTRNLDADIEYRVGPGLALAAPSGAPVGLRFGLLAGIEIDQYTAAAAARGARDQPRLADSFTTDPRGEFFFQVTVGAEFRAGRVARRSPPEPEERPRRGAI